MISKANVGSAGMYIITSAVQNILWGNLQEAVGDVEDGIRINGECMNNIRYADGTVVFVDSYETPGVNE